MTYESPIKKQLEESLVKMGKYASPEIRKTVEDAITKLDHTCPKEIVDKLPSEVMNFYWHTSLRAMSLVPLVGRAMAAGCFIEGVLLAHGMAQFSLRGLYVMAWQRAKIPTALTKEEIRPFYKQRSHKGALYPLIGELESNHLLFAGEVKHLHELNEIRNKAAHGVIFGEITHADLEAVSIRAQETATLALKRFRNWFLNPQPLRILPQ